MRIVLTESQYQKVILESASSRVINKVQEIIEFTKRAFEKGKTDMGYNISTLIVWGYGVGGIMKPLDGYLKTGNFELNEYQHWALIFATTAILLGENQKNIKQLMSIIKKEGLTHIFTKLLNKGEQLKEAFLNFIASLNVTMYRMSNIMAYAIIIPLLHMFYDMSQTGTTPEMIKELVTRIVGFGLISISGNALRDMITKIINRFRD